MHRDGPTGSPPAYSSYREEAFRICAGCPCDRVPTIASLADGVIVGATH
jgi:hypothetical protein